MKRIIILSLALVSALVSCNKAAPDKASVEEGFAPKGSVPTATISKDIQTDGEIAVVTVSFSGVSGDAMDSLSIGLLYGTDETFYNSSFEPAEELKDGSYTLVVSVKDGTTNYFRAVAANINGTSYSEAVPVQIPKLVYNFVGAYSATVYSELLEEEIPSVIEVYVSENNPSAYLISGIAPEYSSKYYPDGNYVKAVYDEEEGTITIPYCSSINLGGYYVVGIDAPDWKSATGYSDIVFEIDGDGNLYRENAIVEWDEEDEEFEYAVYGGVTYVKIEKE